MRDNTSSPVKAARRTKAPGKKPIPYNEQAVRKIAKTRHVTQADYKIAGVPGLVLTVFPSGVATYAVRFSVAGKQRRVSIGEFDVIDLADARTKALNVAAGASDDVDVLARDVKDASRPTLKGLWDERVAKDDKSDARTLKNYGLSLTKFVLPKLGARFAADITADDFADVLEDIEVVSKSTAHQVRSALSGTYRWGQRRRLVRINPIQGLGFTHASKPRKVRISDAQLLKLWSAITTADGLTEPMRNILRLGFLTGQRNNEVAGMATAELKGLDTSSPRWEIPAERMKRKSADQFVPLSKQAAAIVTAALATSSNGMHVFEGAPNGRRGDVWVQGHISQQGVSRAMAKVRDHASVDIRLHDMRKVITTWLAENSIADDTTLDAILHHGKKGVTATHYNFATYEKQMRPALQKWADHIDGLAPTVTSNVHTLNPARAKSS